MQKIIGITGGTGCGKTTALTALQALGVRVIDCDALYHRLLETDKELLHAIDRAFPGVITNGVLQRKALGHRVFGDPAALDTLNKTVWPFVVAAAESIVRAHAPDPCAIDAIGLVESGLVHLCTHTVAITAPESVRTARLMARDGIDEAYASLRIQSQKSNEEFSRNCSLTIENYDDSAEAFQNRCTVIFQSLLKEDAYQ